MIMIYLKNYSEYNTFIRLDEDAYVVVDDADKIDGIGGFTETNEMLGFYIENDKFFFCYECNKYEVVLNEFSCVNEKNDDGKRKFKIIISDRIVCEITYEPYVNPIGLVFGEEDDEFDFLLFLSKYLQDEVSVTRFFEGLRELKKNRII